MITSPFFFILRTAKFYGTSVCKPLRYMCRPKPRAILCQRRELQTSGVGSTDRPQVSLRLPLRHSDGQILLFFLDNFQYYYFFLQF